MKHLLHFRNCTALFVLILLVACKKNEGLQYEGFYTGKEYRTTKIGIGDPYFEHDTVDMVIEVVEWNDKVIVEGDTLQLDDKGEFYGPQFTVIFRNDSLYRSKIQGATLCNFKGKRE